MRFLGIIMFSLFLIAIFILFSEVYSEKMKESATTTTIPTTTTTINETVEYSGETVNLRSK